MVAEALGSVDLDAKADMTELCEAIGLASLSASSSTKRNKKHVLH